MSHLSSRSHGPHVHTSVMHGPTEATQTRAQRGKLYPHTHTHITKAQESNPQPCFASATSYNLFSCFIRREKVPLQGKEASPEQPQCSIFLKMFRAFTSFSDRTSRIGRQQKETKVLKFFFFSPQRSCSHRVLQEQRGELEATR